MASEVIEKDRQLRTAKLQVRFYIVLLAFIAVAASAAAYGAIYYIRKDNQQTRNQINCIVDGFLVDNPQEIPSAVHKCKE